MGNYFKFLTCHKKEANNSYLPLAFSYQLTCVLVENLQKEPKKMRNGLRPELTAKGQKLTAAAVYISNLYPTPFTVVIKSMPIF